MAYRRDGRARRQRLQLSDYGNSYARDCLPFPGEESSSCSDPRKPIYLVRELRGRKQGDDLCLRLWENFAQSLECRRMRLGNGQGYVFLVGDTKGHYVRYVEGSFFGVRVM